MSVQTDLKQLYSNRILALCADIPHHVLLEDAQAMAQCRSPICGSSVDVSLSLKNDIITHFGQRVKACALGQASAAVLGHHIIGCSVTKLQHARDELKNMLQNEGHPPSAPFEELENLLPAREFHNRHSSILLPFEASLKACNMIKEAS